MRYFSAIRIEPERHLEEIYEKPYLTFSTDFMYNLAKLYAVNWHPIKSESIHNSYTPHPLSPYTKNVKEAMQYVIAKSPFDYDILYDELIPCDADNKLELFVIRIKNILKTLVDNLYSAFFTLLHVGRWTIRFYKDGVKDAAHLAPYLIADALEQIIEKSSIFMWFKKFDEICEDIVELLKSGYSEGFLEEEFYYYEDLEVAEIEDGQSDEMMICGDCDVTKCSCGECSNHNSDSDGEFDTDYEFD